jgi:hypothetical protein
MCNVAAGNNTFIIIFTEAFRSFPPWLIKFTENHLTSIINYNSILSFVLATLKFNDVTETGSASIIKYNEGWLGVS